ncbi:peptidoglycan-binding protein [Candidatus Uhrbacteria bacterium]|nr:peptidoglycan-binding protein [Candidatus Uhrbacteria bacterium]
MALPLTVSAATLAELQAEIQALLAELDALKAQLQQVQPSPLLEDREPVEGLSPPTIKSYCLTISRNLSRGSRGNDVKALQEFLIAQDLLAPDSVTGFFGTLTEKAVQEWQRKYNIVSFGTPATTGYGAVGPRTRAAMKNCTLATITTVSPILMSPSLSPTRPPISSGGDGGEATHPTPAPSPPNQTLSPTAPSPAPAPLPAPPALSCAIDGAVVPSGSPATFYSTRVVTYAGSCTDYAQSRTCTNGSLSGHSAYQYATCRVEAWDVFNAKRREDWATQFEGSQWDNIYNGTDSAADNVPNPFRWMSAIDDDWNFNWWNGEPLFNATFRLNSPGRGLMYVNRAYNSADQNKTGNIWTEDPVLQSASSEGVTIEASVELLPESQKDAFVFNFVNEKGAVNWTVALTPSHNEQTGRVRVGIGDASDNIFSYDITPHVLHTVRVIQSPAHGSTFALHVYIDGAEAGYGEVSRLPLGTSDQQTFFYYPRVLIGDTSNAPDMNAAYILDYAKYRRGEIAPNQGLTALSSRSAPALPPAASSAEAFSGALSSLAEFNARISGGASLVAGPDGKTLWNATSNVMLCNPPGTSGTSGATVEAKLKVHPGSDPYQWALNYVDGMGSATFSVSENGITMNSGTTGVGLTTHSLDLTDGYHVIRLVRPASSVYAYLYVDGIAVPVISDYHIGGDKTPATCRFAGQSANESRLFFGQLDYPVPSQSAKPNVEVEYVRWNGVPAAPAAP